MLQELVADPGETDPEALYEAYLEELAAIVDEAGASEAAAETGLDETTLAALPDDGNLSVADAAAIRSLADGTPDADAIADETLDHVLLGMTTAVLDVESVAANLDLGLSGTGVQQRIEGRTEMSLREYAHVLRFVESRKP